MALAVIRSIDSPRRLCGVEEAEEFEQELVDQYLLAMVGAGIGDNQVSDDRRTIFEFVRFLARPVWTAQPADADSFLAHLRKHRGQARSTVQTKAWTLAQFFDFLLTRYQGDIHALTGVVILQPIDEFNRPSKADYGAGRVPPPEDDIEGLFSAWRESLPEARKYLPAARDYMTASLWRRAGLRITETTMLDIGDWRPDFGELGKLHVRFGKGSRGRGPKTRLVPGINAVDVLMDWWLSDVRHQFGDDWSDPAAPMFPSERHDPHSKTCTRVGPDALRAGLAGAVTTWLPTWAGKLTPHGLRHFCASSLYARGVDLKAIQELLGHEWLSTTTGYIHVHANHIELAWSHANKRVADRFDAQEG